MSKIVALLARALALLAVAPAGGGHGVSEDRHEGDRSTRSGIFGFGSSTGSPTQGCVSLALPHLVEALRRLEPSRAPLIAIGTPETIRRL